MFDVHIGEANGNGAKMISRYAQRARLARWRRLAAEAPSMAPAALRDLRADARQIGREIKRILQIADQRLAQPAAGSDAMQRPATADWAWRPDLWRMPIDLAGLAPVENGCEINGETRLYHDSAITETAVRQLRNARPEDLAPFALRIDSLGFQGSFLSVSVGLPQAALTGLRLTHLIRVEALVESERPTHLKARLNVKHGPNVEQSVADMPAGAALRVAEFDLAHSRINDRRIEQAWLDIFFDPPAMNRIDVRDLTMSRRPRAEL